MNFRYQPNQPIDGASLALFRIVYGCVLAYFTYKEIASGQVLANYLSPVFHFKYPGFHWVDLSPEQLLWCYKLLAAGGIMLALGLLFRVAAVINFFAFGAIFLFERTEYQNHYYFMCLVNFAMIWLPAHHVWSLDNWLLRRPARMIPRWGRDLPCFLMGCAYFFGGIAKINGDWLQGYPMILWADRLQNDPTIGWLMQIPHIGLVMSYAGMLFDLTIVGFLIWRRTRVVAFMAVLAFHILNSQMFTIGVFPWLSIAITTLYLRPDWPRRLFSQKVHLSLPRSTPLPILSIIGLLVVTQLTLPLRYHFLPGEPSWTRFGHLFSWRMKLNSRNAEVTFHVRYEDGRVEILVPGTILSIRQVSKMSTRPELIRQFAHYLREQETKRGHNVQVFAQAYLSWNGRAYQRYIDPNVDLSREPHSHIGYAWVLPNQIPHPSLNQHPGLHPSVDKVQEIASPTPANPLGI